MLNNITSAQQEIINTLMLLGESPITGCFNKSSVNSLAKKGYVEIIDTNVKVTQKGIDALNENIEICRKLLAKKQ